MLPHLRNGDTFTRLAAGFEIGVATAPMPASAPAANALSRP